MNKELMKNLEELRKIEDRFYEILETGKVELQELADETCENCPFAGCCYGCGIWEELQGQDL